MALFVPGAEISRANARKAAGALRESKGERLHHRGFIDAVRDRKATRRFGDDGNVITLGSGIIALRLAGVLPEKLQVFAPTVGGDKSADLIERVQRIKGPHAAVALSRRWFDSATAGVPLKSRRTDGRPVVGVDGLDAAVAAKCTLRDKIEVDVAIMRDDEYGTPTPEQIEHARSVGVGVHLLDGGHEALCEDPIGTLEAYEASMQARTS